MPQHWIIVELLQGFGIAIAAAAFGYAWAALLANCRSMRAFRLAPNHDPGVHPTTVLKPLRGADPHLYENLRTFCTQSHPDYQLVFGVRDFEDPAIAVVNRLRAEFPRRDMTVVINPATHGSNPKVSNLINMLPFAKHDWLVLADSDIRVPVDYLTRVTAPLAAPDTGIVTCLYRGIAERGFWSWLGRMFIDDWFAPSVRLAYAFSPPRFAFGSTIALRRDVLRAIGGFEVLRDTLADDYWLGELVRRRDLHIVASDLLVGTQVSETRLSTLWTRELRWLRTVRAIAPWGFAMTWVCFTSPVAVLGFALAPGAWTASLAGLGIGARLVLHFMQSRAERSYLPWYEVLLVPLRDTLLLLQWATALTGWRVHWHGRLLDARTIHSAHGLIRNSTT
jgi:ceramide glucosyltransferase